MAVSERHSAGEIVAGQNLAAEDVGNGARAIEPIVPSIAVFSGRYQDYVLAHASTGELDVTVSSAEGVDRLRHIDFVRFDNGIYGVKTGTFVPNVVDVRTTSVVTEGDGRPLSFTFTRTGDFGSEMSLRYTTETFGATAADFSRSIRPGTIQFKPGQSTVTLSFGVVNDRAVEGTEALTLKLTQGSHYELGSSSLATGVIEDDDKPSTAPLVFVVSARAAEGDGRLVFNVTLSGPSASPVIVAFMTSAGTATAGADFIGATGTLTFAPGETSKTIEIDILNDSEVEADETFLLDLTSAAGATIARASATGTIVSDDRPELTVALVDKENESPATGVQPSTEPVPHDLAGGQGTGSGAVSTVRGDGTNMSVAGETARTLHADITVGGIAATDAKPAPTLVDVATMDIDQLGPDFVELSELASGSPTRPETPIPDATTQFSSVDPAGGTVLDEQVIAIADPAPLAGLADTFSFNFSEGSTDSAPGGQQTIHAPVSKSEGALPLISISDAATSESEGVMRFVVTLSEPAMNRVTVDVELTPSTAAVGQGDGARGTLAFEPGESIQVVTVSIRNDMVVETDETFLIRLTNPVGGILDDAQAAGTIINDDFSDIAGADPTLMFAPTILPTHASMTEVMPQALPDGAGGTGSPRFANEPDYTLVMPF